MKKNSSIFTIILIGSMALTLCGRSAESAPTSRPGFSKTAPTQLTHRDAKMRREAVYQLVAWHQMELRDLQKYQKNLDLWEKKQGEMTVMHVSRWGAGIIPAFVEALEDPDDAVYHYTATVLACFGDEVVPRLAQSLSHLQPLARSRAAHILGNLKGVEALPGLHKAVNDPSLEVRKEALWALGEIGDPSSLTVVTSLLEDANKEIAHMALGFLGRFGDGGLVALAKVAETDPDRAQRKTAVDRMAYVGASAVPTLSRVLRHEISGEVRRQVIISLGRIRDPESLQALVGALKDPEPLIRQQALLSIGRIGDVSVLQDVRGRLGDPEVLVRTRAIQALEMLQGDQLVPSLIEAFQDGDPEVRGHALETLDRTGDPGVFPVMMVALEDDDAGIRLTAIRMVERCVQGLSTQRPNMASFVLLPDKPRSIFGADWEIQVRPALQKAAKDQEERVSQAAQSVLRQIDQFEPREFKKTQRKI